MIKPLICQTALFDLDGTLVDTSQDLWRTLNHVLHLHHRPTLTHAQVRNLVGHGARALIARGFWGETALPPENDPEFEHAVQTFLAYYRDHLTDYSLPFPGVEQTLTTLRNRGIQLAVVTNKPQEMTLPLLENLNLAHFFSIIIGGNTLEKRKPDPLPIQHILTQLHTPSSLGVMIGDSETDALAARAAGTPLVLVSYGYNRNIPVLTLQPDHIIDCFCELESLLFASH
ncbi:MAG: phosphoglycolate phosphatase [Magnetococcus sp. DMHC-6]